MKKPTECLLQVAMLTIAVIASFGAAEVFVRFKNSDGHSYDIEMWHYAKELKHRSDDPLISHEHIPSKSAVLQNVTIRINERGLRGAPVDPIDSGKRRILFLGSSITLGWGVPEEETVEARLATMFGGDGQNVEVLNAGVGNYNATRYVELFLRKLKDLTPTDIVVHYFVNDADVLPQGGGNVLLRNSQLAVVLWRATHRLLDKTGDRNLEAYYRDIYRPDSPGFKAMLAALDRLRAYADASGIRVYLVMQPDVHNLTNYRLGFIHTIMADVAHDRGFTYIDLLPIFSGQTPSSIWAMPGDPHPNAFGHELMAKAIYPIIKSP